MAPYSVRNPIPNVQQLSEDLVRRLDLHQLDPTKNKNAEEKLSAEKEATRRKVTDPTTKATVIIQDVDDNEAKAKDEQK